MRRRKSMDWVYRHDRFYAVTGVESSDGISVDQEEFVQSGTYGTALGTVTNDERLALVLVDSARNARDAALASAVTPASGTVELNFINPAASPDKSERGYLIHGVDVHVYMFQDTSTWSSTAHNYMACRVIIAEQDPFTGQALLHTNYHMWTEVAGIDSLTSNVAEYANGRQNCWETRVYNDRNQTNEQVSTTVIRARPRFKRRLNYEEGLFLYLEPHPNNTSIDVLNTWCRTLVSR